MKLVTLTLSAEQDLEEITAWYEMARPGLGDAFFVEFQHAVERVRFFPESYQVAKRHARLLKMNVFPYYVLYRIHPAHIEIFAVMHTHRNPRHWQERIQ